MVHGLVRGALLASLAAWSLSSCQEARRTQEEPVPVAYRVVSYNIRHGRGMDGEVDLERTAAVLRRLEPDIVGLQEVDDRVERSGRVNQPEELGRLLDMHPAFGSFFAHQGGQYGMAVLSRHPI
ncbi:MAG: endonuclease/exonuclease/phosphatase family protein, partial [Planctomycetes bacterium]|nr:endonuclease/exonuclease/phosphatase family protein [Planctomycetota bacterium]